MTKAYGALISGRKRFEKVIRGRRKRKKKKGKGGSGEGAFFLGFLKWRGDGEKAPLSDEEDD